MDTLPLLDFLAPDDNSSAGEVPVSAPAGAQTDSSPASPPDASPEAPGRPGGPRQRRIEVEGLSDPVAQVVVSSPLPGLSKSLDYLVPVKFAQRAQVGMEVRIRVGGRVQNGFILSRSSHTTFSGKLQPLLDVLGSQPLLLPAQWQLLEKLALHYGTFATALLRQVLPARRLRSEAEILQAEPRQGPLPKLEPQAWPGYPQAPAFLQALAQGDSPRAIATLLHHGPETGANPADGKSAPEVSPGNASETQNPGVAGGAGKLGEKLARERALPYWMGQFAAAILATLHSGRSALVILPQVDLVLEFQNYLGKYLSSTSICTYFAGQNDTERYATYLWASQGKARVVIGTRPAAFLPMENLGLVACFDPEHPALRADKWQAYTARQVLLYRAQLENCALLFGQVAVGATEAYLVQRTWAQALVPERTYLRQHTARIRLLDEYDQMAEGPGGQMLIPGLALRLMRQALEEGPVLVHTPQAGYVEVLCCATCGQGARCGRCQGPLKGDPRAVVCQWCGATNPVNYHCPACGGGRLRRARVGSGRIGEEIGRVFRRYPVVVSDPQAGQIDLVDARPRVVVAAPGYEPRAQGGYRAGLVVGGNALARRIGLDIPGRIMREWLGAAALVRPGGRFLICATLPGPLGQALTRFDPWSAALTDLNERAQLHFAPVYRTVLLCGPRPDLEQCLQDLLPALPGASVLGPVPDPGEDTPAGARALLQVPLRQGAALGAKLQELTRLRAAHHLDPLAFSIDPPNPT